MLRIVLALGLAMGAVACGDDDGKKDTVDDSDAGTDAGKEDPGKADRPDAGPDRPAPVPARACEDDDDCDNGLVCDGVERCVDNRCELGERETCDDDIECTRDRCSDTLGRCVHLPPDQDGDGHPDVTCVDADGEPFGDDCDDTDAQRFPGNVEYCDDSHDEDCVPETIGLRDNDRDGFTDVSCCNIVDGESHCGRDCDDRSSGVNPNVPEVCDTFDNDCDGETDEGLLVETRPDLDGDRHGDSKADPIMVCPNVTRVAPDDLDCDDGNRQVHAALPELCDGIDNNCDGMIDNNTQPVTWYFDLDGDGFGSIKSGTIVSCAPVVGASLLNTDCDDGDPDTYPGADELCDGLDNDCNGLADYQIGPADTEDDDEDGSPDPACNQFPDDCDDNDDSVYPGAVELCDGLDNDCNGIADANTVLATWFRDDDDDGFGDNLDPGLVSCEAQPGRVRVLGDCDDGNARINPDVDDDCSGEGNVDDDCDGDVDEAEQAYAFYPDLDGDGFGNGMATPFFACAAPSDYSEMPSDCDDTLAGVAPGADEHCATRDGLDNDCDGDIDCLDSDCQSEPTCASLYTLQPPATIDGSTSPWRYTGGVLWVADETGDLAFTLKDPNGMPVQGQTLTFKASEGAAVSAATVVTDASGQAVVRFRGGRKAGTYRFTVENQDTNKIAIDVMVSDAPTNSIHTFANVAQTAQNTQDSAMLPTGPATMAGLGSPRGMARATDGTLYVALYNNCMVVEISPLGQQRVIAGGRRSAVNGSFCGSGENNGDQGPAADAQIYRPVDLALDEQRQRLYVAQYNAGATGRVRVIDLSTGDRTINTYAGGSDDQNALGDGASANAAYLYYPKRLALAADGSLYITEDTGTRVRKVDPFGIITTYLQAGNCSTDQFTVNQCNSDCSLHWDGNGGAYLNARFCGKVFSGGSAYGIGHIADIDDPLGSLTRVAGRPSGNSAGHALGAQFNQITDLAIDAAGNLFAMEGNNHNIRRIDFHTTAVTPLAGVGTYNAQTAPYGDYGPAASAELYTPYAMLTTPNGDLLISDTNHHALRTAAKVGKGAPKTIGMTTVAGATHSVYVGESLPTPFAVEVRDGSNATLVDIPVHLSVDQAGFALGASFATTDISGVAAVNGRAGIEPGLYTIKAELKNLRGGVIATQSATVSAGEPPAGTISTILNRERLTAQPTIGGPAITSGANGPTSIATASDGSIYVGIYSHYRVIRITPEGTIEAVAGTGASGTSGDGGPAVEATMGVVHDIALDEANGRLYVATGNLIRYVDLQTGNIDYLGGSGSQTADPWGDGGDVSDAVFSTPDRLKLGPGGYLYVSDSSHHRMRRIDLSTNQITTVMDGTAASACTTLPLQYRGYRADIAFTSSGQAVVFGWMCGTQVSGTRYVVGLLDETDGSLTPIAGQNGSNSTFATIPAANAALGDVGDIIVDDNDEILIAEGNKYIVRRIDALDNTAQISLAAGTGTHGSGDSPSLGEYGPATSKNLYTPRALAFDDAGRLLIAVYNHDQVLRVW